ncbi:MAG: hypothetical protein QE271_09135 [Bacteriovoracaceae bacterium]|nr:hypothetical protein [Bacteriovoracaceae bacterium]
MSDNTTIWSTIIIGNSFFLGLVFYFYRLKNFWMREKNNQERELKNHYLKKISQMIHDLKSPLSALNVATEHLPSEASEQKKILVSARNRIQAILTELEEVSLIKKEIKLSSEEEGISSSQSHWLCRSIDLRKIKFVVIVEDDESVVWAWRSKLKKLNVQIEVLDISSPSEFVETSRDWDSTFFIVDYDFGSNSKMTGLEFIKKYSLGANAILCTSHFNDVLIQNTVMDLGAKMLPKQMMAEIPIIIETKRNYQSGASDFKIVLIDDDPIIHWAWKKSAELANVTIDGYYSYDEFKEKSYDLDTPIFIDKNLKGECGLKISEHLSAVCGFSKLYLSTGEFLRPSEIPSYLSGAIFDKMFPGDLISKLKTEFYG